MKTLTQPAPCVSCDQATVSAVTGQVGDDTGPLCEDCAYWCDGNITG